jgi:hypothetical protein
MKQISFDAKCYDLATHFLPEDAPNTDAIALARAIQQCVEDWLDYRDWEKRERVRASAQDQS